MTTEQFDAMVEKLELQARNNPDGYRTKVILLAFMGSAYLSGVLLLIGTIFFALLASISTLKALGIKLIIVTGAFIWLIVKALWIKIEPPTGNEVTQQQCPELFSIINDLRQKLKAPHFHHVLITDNFNAGVVQSPRLGIFGWDRNYLLIGLPLMKALGTDQLTAVLAHELGHLAKGHGRLAHWIYRQRLRWSRLMSALEASDSRGLILFKPFFAWYAPYFSAYSFPHARAEEYVADEISVRLTSARTAAEALTTVDVVARYLHQNYWSQIYQQADNMPQPEANPYSSMSQAFTSQLDQASLEEFLAASLSAQTSSADTHPSLRDRLAAFHEQPHLSVPEAGSASDKLLGDKLPVLISIFDHEWRTAVQSAWEERHQEILENRKRLEELNARFEKGETLTVDEALDRAVFTESLSNDAESALLQLRMLYEKEPAHAYVCFSLGTRLLDREPDTAITLLEKAAKLDPKASVSVSEILRNFFMRAGKKTEFYQWNDRYLAEERRLVEAEQERNRLSSRDRFETHGLPETAINSIRQQVQSIPEIRSAFLVRKQVKQMTDRPCYVFGFSVTGMLRFHSTKRADSVLKLVQQSVQFAGDTLIINIDAENASFGRVFKKIIGSRIL